MTFMDSATEEQLSRLQAQKEIMFEALTRIERLDYAPLSRTDTEVLHTAIQIARAAIAQTKPQPEQVA